MRLLGVLSLALSCCGPTKHGMSKTADIPCGTTTCTFGQTCCGATPSGAHTCQVSCAATDKFVVGCDGPEDCAFTADVCCSTYTTDASCDRVTQTDSCAASCEYKFPKACSSSVSLRRCSSGSDCANDPGTPYCCAANFGFGQKSPGVCVDSSERDHYKSLGVACEPGG